MNQKSDHIRAFIAISPPGHVKKVLKDLQAMLKKAGIHGAYPRLDTLHLTLKFLGDVPVGSVGLIQKSMETAARDLSGFELTAGGIGVFPTVKNARVIWGGTGGRTDLLELLFSRLDNALSSAMGLQKETRRFAAHFTLARVKQRVDPKILVQLMQDGRGIRSEPFKVNKLSLYQSRLTRSGAVYTELFKVNLE